MSMRIWLDGRLVPEREAKVSVFDHGLLYGDGVFEGIRVYGGRIFRLREHLLRLAASARAIMLDLPLTAAQFQTEIVRTVRANGLRDGYIRVVVTRGVGDLGLDPRKCPKPTVFIIANRIQLYPESFYQEGLSIVTVATRRMHREALNPAIKSLNYLNNILARIEANVAGAQEALVLNQEGFVAECTGENIFLVRGNCLLTPPVSAGALPGITRQVVMEIGRRMAMDVREENLTRYDIFLADECFLTGTAAEIVPVSRCDGRPVGSGSRPVTERIRKAFRRMTRTEGVRALP
mgnify:CR=1 FL=1